jgi:hypothetical protein
MFKKYQNLNTTSYLEFNHKQLQFEFATSVFKLRKAEEKKR